MRSLLLRVFVAFWSIILITIVVAAGVGFLYAERVRTTIQNFEVSDAMLDASAALDESGREGLGEWLGSLPGATAQLVFIVDERGRELLGRPLPPPVALAMRRFGRGGPARMKLREPGNLRPARPFTQLVGPNNEVYTLFVLPPQKGVARWLAERGGATLVLIALLVSAAMSYLLARSISRPIRRFRESANAIADGDLDTRVVASVGTRRDEIGLLAEDFDRMAAGLQRAWRRQSELTANVSHELRSPLARLRVALELARRKTGELAELDRIDTETERLDALIGQLLEFSRLDTAPDEEPVEVDLDALVLAVVDDVAFEFGEACRIDVQSAAETTTRGYPAALRGAIENVVRNAVQHNPAGGAVQVTLDADDANAVVTISDSGGGVAGRELERVFEPFYRAGRNRTSNSGSGLGLAIAARAIDLNGGTISARNEGDGLSVEIRLPGRPQPSRKA